MLLLVCKLLDSILTTLKTIFLIRNKNFLSALFNTLAYTFYLLMIVNLSKSSSTTGIILISLITFVGSYFPSLLADKLSKDKVWVFEIIPCNNQEGKDFADMIRDNNLAIITYKGFNINKESVICSKVYSESKEQSKLIQSMIPESFSYHIQEIKNKIGGL